MLLQICIRPIATGNKKTICVKSRNDSHCKTFYKSPLYQLIRDARKSKEKRKNQIYTYVLNDTLEIT